MIVNPIIPVWLMAVICIGMLLMKRKGFWPFFRQILIVILLFVMNLRIMIPGDKVPVQEQEMNVQVLFVVDDTISMIAQDSDGGRTRLETVKEDCRYIIDGLPGARFAVMTFHNTANMLSPFTDNAEYVKSTIESVYPLNDLYARGSSMNVAKEMLAYTLKDIYEKRNTRTVLFFLSDGEVTDGSQLESFQEMASYIGNGAVLGYGTKAGGNMYVKNYDDELVMVEDKRDYPYKPAVSRIDETKLNRLAKDMGIEYINRSQGDSLDGILSDIKKNATIEIKTAGGKEESNQVESVEDIYYFLAIPLMVLFFFEVRDVLKKRESGGEK